MVNVEMSRWRLFVADFLSMKVFPSLSALFLTKEGVFINAKTFLSLQTSDASKFIVAHSPNYVTFLPNAGAIPSDEISNVIGLAMGFSSTKVSHRIQRGYW